MVLHATGRNIWKSNYFEHYNREQRTTIWRQAPAMNIDALRTFIEVIETGSLVGAARRLNVTQSTVTARMDRLEEEVGQKLLHRYKSGAELTSAGFTFQRYAELMLQVWRRAKSEASLPEGVTGACNLGCDFDLWENLGERFVAFVHEHCPGVGIAAWPGEQLQLDRWLGNGLVDVALCYAPQAREPLTARLLFDDDLVLVAAGRACAGSAYIYVDHGDEFRRQHAIAFPTESTPAVVLASSRWGIDYLLRWGGSGYLPLRHARAHIASGGLALVPGARRFKRSIYAVWNPQSTASWDWFQAALARVGEVGEAGDLPPSGGRGSVGSQEL
jgi:LysR family transcriptional regulator, flagellar master operon regulator